MTLGAEITKEHVDQGGLVHRHQETGIQEIHQNYGLWIISSRKSQRLPEDNPSPNPRMFTFYAISQVLEGKAYYWTPGGRRQSYGPGEAVLMVPGFQHYYGGDGMHFLEDTVRFTGPIADQLMAAGILLPGVVHIGESRRLLPIMDLAQDPAVKSQVQANLALQNLLVEIYLEGALREPVHGSRIREVTRLIHQDPAHWWTVPELAELCRLSVNQFRHVFEKETGHTPKRYIDIVRMNLALRRLDGGDATIANIAQSLGYSDPYHFSRRFKQLHGCSPLDYRNRNRSLT